MIKFNPIYIASLLDEISNDESLGYKLETSLCTPRKMSFLDDEGSVVGKKAVISFSDDEERVVEKQPVFTSRNKNTQLVESDCDDIKSFNSININLIFFS